VECGLLAKESSLPFDSVPRFLLSAHRFPGVFANFMSQLAIKAVRSAESNIGDPIKTIIVFDQDNRLFWHAHQEKLMSVQEELRTAKPAYTFTKYIQFDFIVFCASADNEGWERKGLVETFTVSAEPVPQDCIGLIVPALADSTQFNLQGAALDHFWHRLKEVTGLYPLELRLFALSLDRGNSLPVTLNIYSSERCQEVSSAMEGFIGDNVTRRDSMFALLHDETRESKLDARFDRRYVHECLIEKDGEILRRLKFISPVVADAGRDLCKRIMTRKSNNHFFFR
jgi:hypothetical protein